MVGIDALREQIENEYMNPDPTVKSSIDAANKYLTNDADEANLRNKAEEIDKSCGKQRKPSDEKYSPIWSSINRRE